MSKQEIGRAPPEIMDRWRVCLDAVEALPTDVCVYLARREQRRNDVWTGTMESSAASEIYMISLGKTTIPDLYREEIQPALDRVEGFDVAVKLVGDE